MDFFSARLTVEAKKWLMCQLLRSGLLRVNRYSRGLETCPQANFSKSVHSATTRFTSRISEPRVENTLHTSAKFRLYWLRKT